MGRFDFGNVKPVTTVTTPEGDTFETTDPSIYRNAKGFTIETKYVREGQ